MGPTKVFKSRRVGGSEARGLSPLLLALRCTKDACFGSTYTKIGIIQRLAWPLRRDGTQICEAFHIFFFLRWTKGPLAKKCGQRLEAKKSKEMDFLLWPPERNTLTF